MGIATAFENKINLILNLWVNATSAAFAGALLPVALAGFTLYITLLGWTIMRGEAADPLHEIVKRLLRLAFIGGLALTVGYFNTYIINAVNGAQGALVQSFAAANGGVPVFTVGNMIDNAMAPYKALYSLLWSNATVHFVPSFAVIIAAIIVGLAQLFVTIVALGYYILAKVTLALCVAVGPVFILLAAFESTRQFTWKWIGQLANYVLQIGFIAGSLTLLTNMLQNFATTTLNNYNTQNQSIILDSLALFVLSVCVCVIIWNIHQLTHALTGGATVGNDTFQRSFVLGRGAATGGATRDARLARAQFGGRGGNQVAYARAGAPGLAGAAGNVPIAQANVIANLAG
jgi:type IV secretion system protein VirB6